MDLIIKIVLLVGTLFWCLDVAFTLSKLDRRIDELENWINNEKRP